MQLLRAAVVLLLVCAALPPLASAGTPDDPELTDAAGDQVITRTLPGGLPQLSDDDFDDIDITAAWIGQRVVDCVSAPPLDCPPLRITIQTTAAWTTGTLTGSFRMERGPTSYAATNASGQTISFTVTGTTVTGVANATASNGVDGLEVRLPIPRLGLVGGDLVTNLTLTATRTNPGTITDPSFTQDDSTGTDEAGPGSTYTMLRPAPVAGVDVSIATTGNQTGNAVTVESRGDVPIDVRITNLGTDDDAYSLSVSTSPTLKDPPVFDASLRPLALGATVTPRVFISLDGLDPGLLTVTFTVTTERGATDSAFANIVLDLPAAAEREVVPSGIEFLTPAAEAIRLDDAFDRYAEAVLLALLVLVVILLIFLAVALGRSRLAGTGDPPAAALPEPTPAATSSAKASKAPPAPAEPPADPAAATVGGALTIESIVHEPPAPEEGEEVTTEVLLRNPGPTRQVRVILARDGADLENKTATLPARSSKTVRLKWTAAPGENDVRVRVMPA